MKHNMNNITYQSWCLMKQRCLNKKAGAYKDYGGRGIKVCSRWLKFENFYADMGDRPSKKHSIDRIDNNGNYELKNCKWSTRKEQANNRRTNHLLTYKGKTQTIAQWAEELKMSYGSICNRLRNNLKIEEVLNPNPIKRIKIEDLSPQEEKVWGFILGYTEDYKKSPTYREIGTAIGTSAVHIQINVAPNLKKKGWIRIIPKIDRGIRIITT